MPKNRNPSARFWNYEETPDGQPAVLRLDGTIASESWWGDEVTPAMFREELEAHPGDIVVYINSPGGDVIAASQIYTMLMEHKGSVTVKIEGIAASAASVVAMAGTSVLIAPTAWMMIHNAWSIAMGNKADMRHEAEVLEEIDKGIREAYHIKTGLRDSKLAQMMEDETWMSARTALELGFVDGFIERAETPAEDPDEDDEDDDPDEDDALAVDPDEDDTDEDGDDPDEDDEDEDRLAAMLRRMPAVAWSARKQVSALRRQLRFEEVLESANHKNRKAGPQRGQARDTTADDARKRAEDEANTQRLKLRLLSL